MKILHVSTPKTWRGGEQQLAYLCTELQKKGMEQMVVCRKGGQLADFCKAQNIAFKALSQNSGIDISFAYRLAKAAKKFKADIVHAHDAHAHTFSVMAARFFGLRQDIVLHRRVDYPVKNKKSSIYKYNFPQIKKIICVSAEVKRILDQKLKDTSKSTIVYSGVDLNKFEEKSQMLRQEFKIPFEKVLIGNVAAITQQKDYFTFVDTAEKVLQQTDKAHFIIIGSGDQEEEIKTLVHTKKLDAHFTFTGFRQDIPKVLPALDILLFPSEKEGLGTTVIDAFAAQVPVVASNAGGIKELIEHQKTGFMADVRDSETLAAYCLQLINNPTQRGAIAQNAFQRAQLFSKENMAEGVLNVYREVLKT